MKINVFFVQLLIGLYVFFGLSISATAYSAYALPCAALGLIIVLMRNDVFRLIDVRYFFLCFFIAISWLWSPDSGDSAVRNFITAVTGGFFLSLAYNSGFVDAKRLTLFLFLPFFVNLYAYVSGINLTLHVLNVDSELGWNRFSGYIGAATSFSFRMTLPLVVIMVLNLKVIDWRVASLYVGALVAVLFSIYVSGSRKPFIVLAVSFVWIYYSASGFYKVIFSRVALVSAGVLLFFGLTGLDDITAVGRLIDGFYGEEQSLIEREDLVYVGGILFLENPFFGLGINSFAVLSGFGYYSHNNFVELAVMGGLIGLICYYYFFVSALYRLAKVDGFIWFWCVLVLFFLIDMTTVSYLDRAVQIVFLIILFKAKGYKSHEETAR